MAGARIRGITIEIGGNTSELVKALKSADSAIKNTQSNLRDINKALKIDPSNTNLLKDKQRELAAAISETKDKLDAEKQALEEMKNTQGFDANSEAARNLQTQIDLDTAALKELEAQAKQSSSVLGSQMQAAGEKIQEVGRKIQDVGNKISGMGSTLTQKVTMPIVGAFGTSVKAAVDWESAFTGVMKTVDETATTTYDDLKQSISQMATETASSKNDIAAVMEIAGQLGVSADDITEFTKVMIELGDTTNLSSEQAAESLAKFANVTNMSLSDVDKLGATIVDLGNNFATTEADIVSMATRLSSAGAQVGLSQGEIMGLSTALSSVGIEAEMGGSAFSKAMIKMQVAVETGYDQVNALTKEVGMSLRDLELMSQNDTKGFKELAGSLGMTKTELLSMVKAGTNLEDFAKVSNMTVDQFVQSYRDDAPSAIQAFIHGLGDVEGHGETTIAMLQEMGFTEVRLRDTLTRLANSGDLVTRAVDMGNTAWQENSALTNEAEKRYGTMAAKMSQLKERVTDVAISVGETLMPHVEKGMSIIEKWVEKWKSLDSEQQKAILKFLAIAAAVGPLLIVIGKVVTGIGGLVTGIGKLVSAAGKITTLISSFGGIGGAVKAAIAAITSPIGIVVAAVAALAAGFIYLYTTSEEFRTAINSALAGLQAQFAATVEALKPIWETIKQIIAVVMEEVRPMFTLIAQAVIGFVSGVLAALAPLINFVVKLVETIVNIVKAFFALLNGDFESFKGYLMAALQSFIESITSFFMSIVQFWLAFFQAFGINLQTVFTNIWNAIKLVTATVLTNIRNAVVTKWTEIKTWLSDTLSTIYNKFKEMFDKMKTAIKERVDKIKTSIVDGMQNAVDYIKSLPSKFYNWGKDMIQNLIDGIKSKIDAARQAVAELADTIAGYIHFSVPDKGALADADTYMPDFINLLTRGIRAGIPDVERAMQGLTYSMRPELAAGAGGAMGNNTVNITVYGAQGQDVNELAQIIEQRISENVVRRGVAFA